MARVTACTLSLVNWKGVFFERLELDRHVTALEGANGAGKTTMMIAAYVVLLPDLARLRFSNIGESGGGHDRGLWGRLGEPGRPSYATLSVVVPDQLHPLVFGVQLLRKAEPSLELTPFLIRGLPDAQLPSVLLRTDGEMELVPELSELRTQAKAAGATFETFGSAREYFAALFEAGVTPLRLATDDERTKMNELLRTSMTGGISRALTADLRGFLLRPETGLSSTLAHMRQNLDACQRTRQEVGLARELEQELSSVVIAERALFDATRQVLAQEVHDARKELRTSENVADTAKEISARLHEERARRAEEEARADAYVQSARVRRDAALTRRDETVRALSLAERVAQLTAEAEAKTERTALAKDDATTAAAVRDACKRAATDARRMYDDAAQGVADAQLGTDELHRAARDYRRALTLVQCIHWDAEQVRVVPDGGPSDRSLLDTAALLESGQITPQILDARERAVTAALTAIDRAIADARLQIGQVNLSAEDYSRAHQNLAHLVANVHSALFIDEAVWPQLPARNELGYPTAAATALRALASTLTAQVATLANVREEYRQAISREPRQQAVRAALLRASVESSSGAAFFTALSQNEVDTERLRAELDERETTLRNLEQDLRKVEAELATYAAERTLQRRMHELRTSLARALGRGIPDGVGGLTALASELADARIRSVRHVEDLHALRTGFGAQLGELRRESTDRGLPAEATAIGAEPVSARFEELSLEDAARMEATLGPRAGALVVQTTADAHALAVTLPDDAHEVYVCTPEEVARLLHETVHESPFDAHDLHAQYMFLRDRYGLRRTKIRAMPRLGAAARAKRIDDLTARDAQSSKLLEIEREHAVLRAAQEIELAELVEIQRRFAGDAETSHELADPHQLRDKLEVQLQATRAEIGRLKDHAARAGALGTELRRYAADAFLLDEPPLDQRVRELSSHVRTLDLKTAWLSETAAARTQLEASHTTLRHAPKSSDELVELETQANALECERAQRTTEQNAVRELATLGHAFAGAPAERALRSQAALKPALEEQLANARARVADVDAALFNAERFWEERRAEWQAEDAAASAIVAEWRRTAEQLSTLGPIATGTEYFEDACSELALAEEVIARGEKEAKAATSSLARVIERARQQDETEARAAVTRETEQQRVTAALTHWLAFTQAAHDLQNTPFEDPASYVHAEETFAHASRGRAARTDDSRKAAASLLLERLRHARDGEALAIAVRADIGPNLTAEDFARTPHACRMVRQWTAARLPTHIASQISSPGESAAAQTESLLRLAAQLTVLEERLARQEHDLRFASADIARTIDLQLRSALAQVKRLNSKLATIGFGNIGHLRVELRRIEKMDHVLGALREGVAQELLFQQNLPIEEALAELFKRYAGGKTVGQRLLDYREYIELVVEVQRRGQTAFETASPAKLSTGEAIGVGAALMMVILGEWEYDARLLRPKADVGSLRFLFLDEANRLSRDNLTVLFELCETLDLQLLIAAPEVAQAAGNTTYRLVRQVDAQGREEVLVTGRRIRAGVEVAEPSAESAPAAEAAALIEALLMPALEPVSTASVQHTSIVVVPDVIEIEQVLEVAAALHDALIEQAGPVAETGAEPPQETLVEHALELQVEAPQVELAELVAPTLAPPGADATYSAEHDPYFDDDD